MVTSTVIKHIGYYLNGKRMTKKNQTNLLLRIQVRIGLLNNTEALNTRCPFCNGFIIKESVLFATIIYEVTIFCTRFKYFRTTLFSKKKYKSISLPEKLNPKD